MIAAKDLLPEEGRALVFTTDAAVGAPDAAAAAAERIEMARPVGRECYGGGKSAPVGNGLPEDKGEC